jgi:hypothetical protein
LTALITHFCVSSHWRTGTLLQACKSPITSVWRCACPPFRVLTCAFKTLYVHHAPTMPTMPAWSRSHLKQVWVLRRIMRRDDEYFVQSRLICCFTGVSGCAMHGSAVRARFDSLEGQEVSEIDGHKPHSNSLYNRRCSASIIQEWESSWIDTPELARG